jgi:xanthine dehydrogenase accessory factor
LADLERLWGFLLERLEKGIPAGLLAVAESRGSTPGKAGAKMAVAADGELVGTIGGGSMERQWVEQIRKSLCEGTATQTMERQEHHCDGSGMVCGGVQTLILHLCSEKDRVPIARLLRALRQRDSVVLCIEPSGIGFVEASLEPGEIAFHQEGENEWRYLEHIGFRHTAYLVGGGHVSLALSRILDTLDFRIVVFDERPGLNTLVDNPYVHETRIVPFDQVHRHIPEGEHHYVIIMTPSQATDERVLGDLIDKRLRFLGMLGSTAKVAAVLGRLGLQIPPEKLRRVRAPVGLPIGSHRPAEIAVSIAAEMIQVKNRPECASSPGPC